MGPGPGRHARRADRRVNRIRREHAAFRSNTNLRFHDVDNDQLIAYTKATDDGSSQVLVVVNLDPHHVRSGFVDLPLDELGLDEHQPFQVHDLLTARDTCGRARGTMSS